MDSVMLLVLMLVIIIGLVLASIILQLKTRQRPLWPDGDYLVEHEGSKEEDGVLVTTYKVVFPESFKGRRIKVKQ